MIRVWTPIPLAIWTLASVLGLIGLVESIARGYAAPMVATFAVFLAAIAYSAVRYYSARIARKRKVRAQSRTGVEILAGDAMADERWSFGISAVAIKTIDDALAWWVERFPARENHLRRAWLHRPVVVISKPISQGGNCRFAGGRMATTDVQAVWMPGEGFADCADAIWHEMGHVAREMVATDAGEAADHEWFKANGYKRPR